MMKPITATMALEAQNARRLSYSLDRLLHRLLRFVRACPMGADDAMPEHELIWEDRVDYSPGMLVLEAVKSNPELWQDAIPDEVCFIPRKALEGLGIPEDTIDALASMGRYIVDAHAARYEHALKEGK